MFTALLIVAMIALLAGMVVCSKKQGEVAAAKPIAIVLMVLLVLCAFLLIKTMNVFGGGTNSAHSKEAQFFVSQGFVVGKFIASQTGACKVLLVVSSKDDARIPQLMDALKNGMNGGEVAVEAAVMPTQGAQPVDTAFAKMTAQDFDALVSKHNDAKVVVSMVDMPSDTSNFKLLRNAMDGKEPKIILVGNVGMPGLATAIAKDAISAVVVTSPKAVYDDAAVPDDLQDAFNVRYLLINKENVGKYAEIFAN